MDDQELRRKERILAGYREYEITYQVQGKITVRGITADSQQAALKEARCVMGYLSTDWDFDEDRIVDVTLGDPVEIYKRDEEDLVDHDDLYDAVIKDPMIMGGPAGGFIPPEEKKDG
jgi:hypothetical protein